MLIYNYMNWGNLSLASWKVGITLIGPPWSGKSTLARIIHERLSTTLNFHDHDDNWLEPELIRRGYWSITDAIEKMGDRAFLNFEEEFTIQQYGRADENKQFPLDHTLFASSGSLVRSKAAIEHIRARTHIILLDVPIDTVITQIYNRTGGSWRIIGINGWPNGEWLMSENLETELRFRYDLYRTYQDSVLEYKPWENPEQTAAKLLTHIESLLWDR